MSNHNNRREFLKQGTAATVGMLAARQAQAQNPNSATDQKAPPAPPQPEAPSPQSAEGEKFLSETPPEFREFSRYQPSYGGPPGSDTYLGKLVPGLRKTGRPPVPVESPDLGKVPFEMKNGVKEFHLTCEPVTREIIPGYAMNFYGFNGTMPGPTIEANQGDRVRLVVHNKLPEPTTVHWHGLELPVQFDGVPGLTQDPIMPGKTYVYEFDLHQAGTFFYHPHMAMQEAFGMVGMFVIHPQIAFDPPVDRDFTLIFQNFRIRPANTVSDSWSEEWNWHTINGRSGPYTTPMLVKHGERVRIRILNFSPIQHHPIHLHGHTFWLTGKEGARIPPQAWHSRNTELIAVAQASDLEFIAFNPGDWLFHCHMFHHMMNHMVRQVGPRIRRDSDVADYKANLDNRPPVQFPHEDPSMDVPGYPQVMKAKGFTRDQLQKIYGRREVQGMRENWIMGVKGLMTVVRVLHEDLYNKIVHTDEPIPPGVSIPGNPHTPQPMQK